MIRLTLHSYVKEEDIRHAGVTDQQSDVAGRRGEPLSQPSAFAGEGQQCCLHQVSQKEQ